MALEQWIFDERHPAAISLVSGGRDSLLATALAVEEGYEVVPITFDNGHIAGIERANFAVSALQAVYGEDRVHNLVVRKIGMTLLDYVRPTWYKSASELAIEYPNLQLYQLHCLACKTAMYVGALRLCREFKVTHLIDGVRKSQGFFVDSQSMVIRFSNLCKAHGVELLTPVYTLESDVTRKRMLDDRNLPTKTLEPQCYLGCPLNGSLSPDVALDLGRFFDNELRDMCSSDIKQSDF